MEFSTKRLKVSQKQATSLEKRKHLVKCVLKKSHRQVKGIAYLVKGGDRLRTDHCLREFGEIKLNLMDYIQPFLKHYTFNIKTPCLRKSTFCPTQSPVMTEFVAKSSEFHLFLHCHIYKHHQKHTYILPVK
ncbi:hypothetical protein KUTeg_020747 [Tegillarca granosa]|uniref:Uncharacterized protein n=1 Tax=Tegillarca granosa TaxID=220873 RepID=A0ABQ9E9C8_TEGGR|nr:hypothetical protein KUTeg_020747 [Tegillarca granosa]